MGHVLGGLLLIVVWGGSVWLGKAWARRVEAPFWAARLLAQVIGGGAACALILGMTGKMTIESFVAAAVVATAHCSVISWIMRDTPADWPQA